MICSDQIHCKSSSCYFYEFSEAVQKVLQKHIHDFSIQLDNLLQEPESFTQDNIRLLENRLNELKQKELRQWEKYADGEMPKEIFDQLNERIQKNKQAAQIALILQMKSRTKSPVCRTRCVRYKMTPYRFP